MNLGVVGLLGRGPAGLLQSGQGALMVAVQEVAAGEVDPVMADTFAGR